MSLLLIKKLIKFLVIFLAAIWLRLKEYFKKISPNLVFGVAIFFAGFYGGHTLGYYWNPANLLVNQGYMDWAENTEDEDLDYLNLRKLYNLLSKDKSKRVGLLIFTQQGIYLAPNINPAFEIVAGVRRRSDKQIIMGLGLP